MPSDIQNEYIKLASQGDYDAQQKLFEHNLRLVGNLLSKRYYKIDFDKEELFQVGSVGLWKAIQNFDMSFDVEFSTYAIPMIDGEIRRYLRDHSSLLRIPRSINVLHYKITQLQEEYKHKGIELSIEELSNLLEVSEQEISEAIRSKEPVESFSKEMYENKDGNTNSIENTIQDPNVNIEEQLLKTEIYDKVKETIEKLDYPKCDVVKLLCGFDCIRKTQMQVAEKLNMSQPQISRIYKEALNEIAFLLPKSISDEAKKERVTDNIFVDKGEKKEKNIFTLYPNYSKKQILEAVDSLNESDKKIIELKYGINDNKMFSNMEIAEMLNLDRKKLGVRIGQIKNRIGNILKNGLINKRTFYNLFPNYTKDQILEILNSVNEKDKKIIELKYGLNNNEPISNTLITKQLNMSISNVNNHIYSTIKKIGLELDNEIIYKEFPKCTKKQILTVIDTLSERNKKIIELKYGLNGNKITSPNEISNILDIKLETIRSSISNIKTQIENRLKTNKLNKPKIDRGKIMSSETILDLYPGYSKEQILKAIDTLPDENKKVIELKYGLNDNEKLDNKEIAKQLNVEPKVINSRLYMIKQQIKNRLETPQKEKKDTKSKYAETIVDLFPGYTEEQILKAIDNIPELNKNIIELKYGLNGNEKLDNKEIAKQLNIELKLIYSRMTMIKQQIKNRLENLQKETKDTKTKYAETIVELFPGYTEEQILKAIDNIPVLNKKIIELRFGLNGNTVTEYKEISKILTLNSTNLGSRIFQAKKQIRNKLESNTKKNEFIKSYPGYTEEQILKAIDNIPELNKNIIELKYGLNGNNILENKEIAKKLNIEPKVINSRLFMIKQQIKNRLEFPENNNLRKETIVQLFPGYTEEQILKTIDTLSDTNKKVIELKYGLNDNKKLENKEIAKLLNVETKTINSRVFMIKQQISKRLEKSKEDIINITKGDNVEIINFEEPPNPSLDEKTKKVYTNKVKELEESILSNNEGKEDKIFTIGNILVELNVNESMCLFAYQDKRSNKLDRAHGMQKVCDVYIVRATDTRQKETIYENVLVREKKTCKFYDFVKRYTNGDYDLSNVKYNELVCYDIGKSGISLIPIYIEDVKKERPKIKKEVNIVNNELDNEKYKQHIDNGIKLFKDRQIVLAEPEFIEALKSNDKFVLQKANYYLGKVYLAKKKAPIAEKYLKDSLEYNETDYLTLFETGKSLLMQNKYDEAISYFDKCNVVGKPYYITHVLEKAKCYIKQKDFDTALKLYDSCINKKSNDYFAHYEKGKLLFDLKNYKDARKELELCESLDYRKPNHKVILGKIEYIENNIKEATDYFEECIDIDHEHNVIYNIVNIAYFFHERGNRDIAYDYYLEAPVFKKWCKLTEAQVDEHIKQHNSATKDDKMHSVFNFPVSIDILNDLIKDMEKTTTRELYDVYQIYCRDVGYMVIDDNNHQMEDYITILTLPFTKKIMNSYPDYRIEDVKITKSITIDTLNNYNQVIQPKEDNSEIIETEEPKIIEKTILEENTNKFIDDKQQKEQSKKINSDIVQIEEIECQQDVEEVIDKEFIENNIKEEIELETINSKINHVKEEQRIETDKIEYPPTVEKTETKETINEEEVTLIKNKFDIPANLDFEKHKEQIKMLINMLNNPTEQVVLLLRLGFVNDKYYTEEEIAKFLQISEIDVHTIISRSLSNIVGISTLTIQRVESVREQLEITKNLTKQNN